MLIQRYQPAMEPLLALLARHVVESQMKELRNILADIRARIDRFEKRPSV